MTQTPISNEKPKETVNISIARLSTEDFATALRVILEERNLPVRTAHRIATVARIIRAELTAFEEARRGVVASFADKNEDGTIKTTKVGDNFVANIPPALIPECNAKINELMAVEVTVHTIPVDSLGNIEASPKTLMALEFIV
jgi:hypothetical protein